MLYIVLFQIAFVIFVARHEYDKFSAIFVVILTVPWSGWFAQFKSRPGINLEFGYTETSFILIAFAIMNALLILVAISKWDGRRKP